jgi:hypothetical protein
MKEMPPMKKQKRDNKEKDREVSKTIPRPNIDARINGTVLMYDSLLTAVDEAGGTIGGFLWKELETMTVTELLAHLGSNNVRFIYIGKGV